MDNSDKIMMLDACGIEFFVDEGDLYAVDVQPEQVVEGGLTGDVDLTEYTREDMNAWLGLS